MTRSGRGSFVGMRRSHETRIGAWSALAISTMTAIGVMVFSVPTVAYADPALPPPPPPPAADGAPPPDPAAAPLPDADAVPVPDPDRVNVDAGGFSYDMPAGWEPGDASKINYGQAVLTKTTEPGAQAPTDAAILLGKLDLRLFAGAEPDNAKAAVRLASDMGEFFMPFPGVRINQQVIPLDAAGAPGAASYYEVKFNDTTKPDGQIWAAALGSNTPRQGAQPPQDNRWFVVWLGSTNDPIDKAAAQALAESIRPYTPPPPPDQPPPDQNGPPQAPDTDVPPPGAVPPVGVPVPVPPNPEMMPPA